MTKANNFLYAMAIVAALIYSLQSTAQCRKISIVDGDEVITLQYDKNERLVAITGLDDEEGPKEMKLNTISNGITFPVAQKGIKWDDNGDGNYIITLGISGDDDEDERRSMFKINKDGKILSWDIAGEDNFKTTKYIYNNNGDLALMKWEGTFYDTKVTDKGELTATFNTARPDVIMKGGPMLFLVTTRWLKLPMTNSHLITGYSYKQTIHVPERKIELDQKSADGQPMFKIEPEKNITNVITKSFSYTWDDKGRVSSVTISGKGNTKKIQITYSDCN